MTEELQYVLMDPSGNMTILVESPVPDAEQASTAERLLALEPLEPIWQNCFQKKTKTSSLLTRVLKKLPIWLIVGTMT